MNIHEEETKGANEPADFALIAETFRELIVMRAGTLAVAVFADETGVVTEARAITPLPDAPPSVLGVASVRGRMRTVLDPFQLLGADASAICVADDALRFLITLHGDEQLALCAASVEQHNDIQTHDIKPRTTATSALLGLLRHGDSNIFLLNPAQLFDAATHSTERRRHRLKQ